MTANYGVAIAIGLSKLTARPVLGVMLAVPPVGRASAMAGGRLGLGVLALKSMLLTVRLLLVLSVPKLV